MSKKHLILIGFTVPLIVILGFMSFNYLNNRKSKEDEVIIINDKDKVVAKQQYEINPTFYYINEEGDKLSKEVSVTSEKPIASYVKYMLEEYQKMDENLIINIDKDAKFLDYKIEMRVLFINLSKEFQDSVFLDEFTTSEFYNMIAKSLVGVSRNNEFIDFQILIEGDSVEDMFDNGYDTANPLRIFS